MNPPDFSTIVLFLHAINWIDNSSSGKRGYFIQLFPLPAGQGREEMVQDKILCFACAVKGIERTFNSYYELQDHLYKDHDMSKDPAMENFVKEKASIPKNAATT